MTIVVPSSSCRRENLSVTLATLSGSKQPVGSSASSTPGELARVRAMATC